MGEVAAALAPDGWTFARDERHPDGARVLRGRHASQSPGEVGRLCLTVDRGGWDIRALGPLGADRLLPRTALSARHGPWGPADAVGLARQAIREVDEIAASSDPTAYGEGEPPWFVDILAAIAAEGLTDWTVTQRDPRGWPGMVLEAPHGQCTVGTTFGADPLWVLSVSSAAHRICLRGQGAPPRTGALVVGMIREVMAHTPARRPGLTYADGRPLMEGDIVSYDGETFSVAQAEETMVRLRRTTGNQREFHTRDVAGVSLLWRPALALGG